MFFVKQRHSIDDEPPQLTIEETCKPSGKKKHRIGSPRYVTEARRVVPPQRHALVCCAIALLLIGSSWTFGRGPLVDLLTLHSSSTNALEPSSKVGGLAAHDYPILKLPKRALMDLVVNVTRALEDVSTSIHTELIKDPTMVSFAQQLINAPNSQCLKGKIMRAILSQQPFRLSFLNIEGQYSFSEEHPLFGFPKVLQTLMTPVFSTANVNLKIRILAKGTQLLEAYPDIICTAANADIHSDVIVWQMSLPHLVDKSKQLENNIFMSEMAVRYTLMLPRQPAPLLISLPYDDFHFTKEFDSVPMSEDEDSLSFKDVYANFGLHYLDMPAAMTSHSQKVSFDEIFQKSEESASNGGLTDYGNNVVAAALALFYNRLFLSAVEEIVQLILETDTNSIKLSEILAERTHGFDSLQHLPKPFICEEQEYCIHPATCLRTYTTDSNGPHDLVEWLRSPQRIVAGSEISEGNWSKQISGTNSNIPTLVGSSLSGGLTLNIQASRTGYLGICSPIVDADDDLGAMLGRANFLLNGKPVHISIPYLSETCALFEEKVEGGEHALHINPISKKPIYISYFLIP
eukprot:CAMPEP_0117758778 /NCGR_PEP_ID=MMETSP0947-20121206/15610_1 /TAXON_ID=44440 /ORGANISM="Chattonella subsalsa, Strain CCMP2191" /LENGTH=573 /DNA_ID=CAMNT_0005579089 /DNA_START=189 /DNA_END=1910 /DNA_ORIENTATION=+